MTITSAEYRPARRARKRIRVDAMSVYGLGLILYFASASIYVFPSGLPQPSDYLMALSAGFLLTTSFAIGRVYKNAALFGFLFVIYAFGISAIWAVLVSDFDMLRPPAYYVYNFVVLLSVIVAASRAPERTLTLLKYAAIAGAASLLVQLVVGFDSSLRRQLVGFNNPNQLAYFSLCLCGISLVLRQTKTLTLPAFVLLYGACSIPLLTTFSATAIVVWLYSLVIILFSQFKRSAWSIIATTAVVLLSIWVLFVFATQDTYFSDNLSHRISRLDDKTPGVAAQRGYSRIVEFAEYTIFGAGESARWRFGDDKVREIHSTIGTLIFSYGIVGTSIFLAFLFFLARRASLFHLAVLGMPLFFALTHQGLRTTMFWIVLAVVCVAVVIHRKEKVNRTLSPNLLARALPRPRDVG